MTEALPFALTFATALGCGVMSGLFFVFSNTVMPALADRPPAEGMAAMQAINRVIINPIFLATFFGTTALSALGIVTALWHWSLPGAAFLLAGSTLYLAGGVLVTMLANVPLNNRLAAAAPQAPESAALWALYLRRWTAWNHVRTIACSVALALLILTAQRGG
jgi:uncharacterized membrane protein